MATKKKKTSKPALKAVKPAKPSRPTHPKPAPEPDEFSAAGGMPLIPTGLPERDFSRGKQRIKELSWGEFDRQLQALARAAKAFKPEAVVGVVHGGIFVGGALATALKVDFFAVRVAKRSRDTGRDAGVSNDVPASLAGRRVLIVDDIAASGDTLEFATRLAKARGAKAIKTATLISRPGRFVPDYVGITADDFFVFPWDYRDLVDDGRFEPGEVAPPKKSARRS